ncbi:FecR family protein [Chitinophaga ginsengisoli]|uniref:FecR family protein n=1 Tax=Chitinophaga ginsengisoli TaxID=363837 RepID=A0A2P8FQY9_9BACT|nr:FecR family protein [Chitinophaga ginsengisoli]
MKTEALIIAEITGSITSEERVELQELMKTSSQVRALSEQMHKVLDPQKSEFLQIRTTSAEKIIEMGNAQLHKRGKVRRMAMTISVAAACLVGLLFAVFHYSGQKARPEILFGKGQSVWLDLNRKVIALNGQGGEIDASGSFTYNGTETLPIGEVVDGKDSIKLIVPWGREYKIKLSDGTLVHMNSGSVLSWPASFGKGKREVSLRGEAFLTVKENEQEPFIVHLQNEVVQVLGTSFNIKAYNEKGLQVALFTGNIHVKGKGGSVDLAPGQEAVYQGEHLQVQPADTKKVEEWRERIIDLEDARVADVERAVVRYYGEKVVFDPAIGDRRARVSIDREMPVEVFLKQYALVNDLRYSKENGVYRLSLPEEK